MKANDDNKDKIDQLRTVADKQSAIEEKLDELITLLAENDFDSETVKQYQSRLSSALQHKMTIAEDLKAFEVIDKKTDASREQLLDEFSVLLEAHTFNSKATTKYLQTERNNKFILMAIGVIMITLGFAMIIMPAPPYFEMFTIFYFTPDDGVTLMDLISLIIVFAGIYVFVRSLYKKNPGAR
ncbi:hypothetical protein [Mucilaginibacter panaciglaebae]|uniref:Uncharacterized protein n=1 Tax=Mucilaginibacter panaciglaebae TaxID=502331 RepID=A0ABP7WRK0_9SPHI